VSGESATSAKNGGAGARVWLSAAGDTGALYDDPLSKVLGLDAKTSGWGAWFGFTSGSTLLLVGLMALTSVVAWIHTAHARAAAEGADEIEVTKEEPPPPPPEPEAKPEPAAPAPHHVREIAPPPAPAQAAKVLTQEPNPDEPVDLTGNTIVQGSAEAYAGGLTSADGKSTNAVRSMATATGMPAGTGSMRTAPPVVGPDRSRRASVLETEWGIVQFPTEAEVAQIDEALVVLEVDVRPDGTPSAVRILKDPGNGFGRDARLFAMKKRFLPALDHDGNPIASTLKVPVRFTR
jgi:periplasmic protein TonB